MCIKLHFYLIIFAVYFYAIHNLDLFLTFYLFAFLHELMHIIFAIALKVHIKEIIFMPVGVCAKYSYIENRVKEILIAISRSIS